MSDKNTNSNNLAAHILILEDDIDLQELIVNLYKKENFRFTIYSDAGEALARAKDDPEFFDQFDLVLTDFRMPKVSGMQFIQEVRKYNSNVPVILMTATNKTELAVEAIRAGAYDFLVKPVNLSQLTLSIERALDLHRLRQQNESLKKTLTNSWTFDGIGGKSPAMRLVFDLAKKVAKSSANVLIQGESGTGKEVIAKAIHNSSERRDALYVPINCSAIPEALLESELFGHAKGSFTGAVDKKIGLFEEAAGGTIFLDEIGDLNLPLQAKLLRVIQERKIKRIGENTERSIDVRILSATHKDLLEEVKAGRFREDLYFRLNVIQMRIPPLRERKEDILPLAEFFLKRFKAQNNSNLVSFSRGAVEYLWKYSWPGNVRELENAVERATILSAGPLVEAQDLTQFDTRSTETTDAPAFMEAERLAASPYAAASMPTTQLPVASMPTELPLPTPVAEVPAPLASAPAASVVPSSHPDVKQFVVTFPDNNLLSMDDICRRYAHFVVDSTGGVKQQAVRILGIDRKTLYRKLAQDDEAAAEAPMAEEIAGATSPHAAN